MNRKNVFAAAVIAAAAVLCSAAQEQSSAVNGGLAPSAIKQIQDFYAIKASLTPAERKMSTNLVLLSRLIQGKLPQTLTGLVQLPTRDADGKFIVEVKGRSGALRNGLQDVQSEAAVTGPDEDSLRAHVGLTELLKVAQQTDVTAVVEESQKHTNLGSVTSQGYVEHRANTVISGGVRGAGIRVGVLSDSAYPSRVAALIASGDLPADTVVLPGQAGPADNTGEDEGAAMMEIVHDIAPDAKLYFATAFNSAASFASNIRALRNTYGCDIIVDDISYFNEPAFYDGPIAQAVNDVTASGALYFSSAANSGNFTSGTSGTWEGDFVASKLSSVTVNALEGSSAPLHNFAAANSTDQPYDVIRTASSSFIGLHWSDPNGASTNDYDLFVTNSTGTSLLAYGANPQTGTQNPFESASSNTVFPVGSRIYVALYSGSPRALHLDSERDTLTIGTTGATFGHNAGLNTFSSAAVYWNAAKRGATPFTGGSTNPDETFSSDGPRKVFYSADGIPITPGNYLFGTGGGQTLVKPDAAGADGVATATPGFSPFFGTSAAAPHLAGIAALVKSVNPSLTNTQIRNIMTNTTLDNMAAGVDRDSGYGIVSALNAVNAAKATLTTTVK